MKTCQDFMSYHCVTCKTLSRDLPEKCAVCVFNNGRCIDCISISTCAQRPNFEPYGGSDEET